MRWLRFHHLFHYIFLIFCELNFVFTDTIYPQILPTSAAITFDSTTKDVYSYYLSQGLVVADKSDPSNVEICNYSNTFQNLAMESVNNIYYILKVAYVQTSAGVQYEYLINFNNQRLRGQRIPVITQNNNIPGTANFFYNSISIFQMAFSYSDSISPALADLIGVEVTHDPTTNTLYYFFCLNQGIYLASSVVDTNPAQITVAKFTAAQTLMSTSNCQNIIKQNYSTVLINNSISCTFSQCKKYSTTVDISVFLEINGTIKQSLTSINESTWTSTSYSWTTVPILYAFDYLKQDTYTLYILPDSTNTKILLNLRDANDNQVFVGQLNGITSLTNKIISYNTLGLYVIDTTKSTTASIIPFCINSTYNPTLQLCAKSTSSFCLFENNSICLQCDSSTFIDPTTQLCTTCPTTCIGCTTSTQCTACISPYRDPTNSCSCTGGRVEQPNARFLQHQNQSTPRFLQASVCVCPNTTYEDPTTHSCIQCSSISPFCTACSSLGCTACSQGSYLSNYQCIACSTNCLACNASSCTTCATSYYINGSSQCSSCTSLVANCTTCTISGCSQCAVGYYLSNQQCIQCSSYCSGGCSSATNCNSCYTDYRNSLNTCQCIGGRTEAAGTAGQVPCVCQSNQYWDSNQSICINCSTTFGAQCTACTQSGCTTCDQSTGGYYIDQTTFVCKACSATYPNCTQCSSTQCSVCMTGFYLDSTNKCDICNVQCNGGCSSATQCTACYTNYRDASNTCNCVTGRYEQPSSTNQRILKTSGHIKRKLGITDQCVCNTDRVQQADGTCTLCSSLYGVQCTSCTLLTCLTCINGSFVNESGSCQCPSDTYLDTATSNCTLCSTKFPAQCQSCSSTNCLDCGDVNSIYNATSNTCGCKTGYYIASQLSNSFTCSLCSSKYGTNCTTCDSTSCTNCSNGYIYNTTSQQCECPTGYAVQNNTCQQCTTLYNSYCSTCDSTQCTSCTQTTRNPTANCSCSSSDAIDQKGICYLCTLSVSTTSMVALATNNNVSVQCNFSTSSDGEANYVSGTISIYLILSYDYINNQGTLQTNNSKFLLSTSSSITNLVLPHGTHQLQSVYNATGTITFIQTSTLSITVSSIYSNMQSLYNNYFSFKSSSSKLDINYILKYIAEILEIKKVQSDNVQNQKSICSSISQNGSICVCNNSSSYFADCSGPKSSYSSFQLIMMQYSKFLNDQTLTLTALQSSQFQELLPLVSEEIDSTFLGQDNTATNQLLSSISTSVSTFKNVTNLPTNLSTQVTQVTQQISGILDSSTLTSTNSQITMEYVQQIQKAVLQTINPYYTKANKPAPINEVITDNLVLDQKLIQCQNNNFTAQSVQYVIGSSSFSNQSKRLLQNDSSDEKRHLQIRLLDTSSCQVIQPGVTPNSTTYYNGVSASIFKNNPYLNQYDLPYKNQQYELFTTQYKFFDTASGTQNRRNLKFYNNQNDPNFMERQLSDSSSPTSTSLYNLQFDVVKTNPQDNSTTFNYTLFKCIYLNSTSNKTMKWIKCPASSYLIEQRTLSCNCPVQSTYVYDYDNMFTDETSDLLDEIKKNQTALIIIAIVMASIFILLIVLYAFIYKPKHIIHELAQLGKQQELFDSTHVKIDEKMYQVKLSDIQRDDQRKLSYKISESTPYNQINAQQQQQQFMKSKAASAYSPKVMKNQFMNIISNNMNSNNNNLYSSAKFNSIVNQHNKFDTFGNNSSIQYNKKSGNSFQEQSENITNLNTNNRLAFQNPSIFNTNNKQNLQANNSNINETPLNSVQERKDYQPTFENDYTDRISQQEQNIPSEKRLENEIQTQNYLKTNNIVTNRDLQSNAKLQISNNSDENLDEKSKIQFTSKSLSNSRSNKSSSLSGSQSISSGKKEIKVISENNS